jgi:segregation and condensation protein A
MVHRLRELRSCSFRTLVADAETTLVIVARFLALLELFCESAVAFDQAQSLGALTIRWTGQDQGEIGVSDEFDQTDELDETAESDESDVKTAIGEGTPAHLDDVIDEESVAPVE